MRHYQRLLHTHCYSCYATTDDNATKKMVSFVDYSTTVRKHKSITRRTGSSTGYVLRNFTISFIARGFTRQSFSVLVFLPDMSEITRKEVYPYRETFYRHLVREDDSYSFSKTDVSFRLLSDSFRYRYLPRI